MYINIDVDILSHHILANIHLANAMNIKRSHIALLLFPFIKSLLYDIQF